MGSSEPRLFSGKTIILLAFLTALAATLACSAGGGSSNATANAEATAVYRQATELASTLAALEEANASSTENAKTMSLTERADGQRATQDAQRRATAQAEQRATESALARQVEIVGELPREARDWRILMAESFDSQDSLTSDWYLGADDDEWAKQEFSIQGGTYVWSIYAKQSVFYRVWPQVPELSDLYVSATLCKQRGSSSNAAGLTFRHDDTGSAYVFLIRNDRRYAFYELVRNTWNIRIDWTQASALIPGECNRVAVLADGNHFTLYANGSEIDDLVDVSLDAGFVGLGIFIDGGETAEWEFDDFAVLVP